MMYFLNCTTHTHYTYKLYGMPVSLRGTGPDDNAATVPPAKAWLRWRHGTTRTSASSSQPPSHGPRCLPVCMPSVVCMAGLSPVCVHAASVHVCACGVCACVCGVV